MSNKDNPQPRPIPTQEPYPKPKGKESFDNDQPGGGTRGGGRVPLVRPKK